MAESRTPPKLDYAPPPPRARKIARRIVVGFALACAALVLVKLVPAEWSRIQLCYYQSLCMNYRAGPDQIAFPTRGDSGLVVHDWDMFYSLLSPPGGVSDCTLFLHERVAHNGNRRLVVVDANIAPAGPNFPDIGSSKYIASGSARVIKPGSLWKYPAEMTSSRLQIVPSQVLRLPGNTFYFGQPDPVDASHFTIRVVSAQTQQIVDGWLLDDDRVLLEPRPPAPLASTQPN